MKTSFHPVLLFSLFGFLLMVSCSTPKETINLFSYEENSMATPWSHNRFDNHNEKFTFAIISDLYGGERPGVIDVALEQINLLRPEFILSVGDLIDGGTEDRNQLNREWNVFDQKVSKAIAPFFYAGGNHDLTNTTMREVWNERYGHRYYHFIYNETLFLVLDSEDYQEERMQEIYVARAEAIKILDGNEPAKAIESLYYKMPERRTGEISDKQAAYFEKIIADNSNVKWTFILMHKPVWMREDKNGLSRIEMALGKRPYTVFNGHFHTYSHTIENSRDYIMLGTTGGSQNDKSDMAFDHFTMVTMTKEGPSIANLRLGGVLDKSGNLPADGETKCFQASLCTNKETNSNH